MTKSIFKIRHTDKFHELRSIRWVNNSILGLLEKNLPKNVAKELHFALDHSKGAEQKLYNILFPASPKPKVSKHKKKS